MNSHTVAMPVSDRGGVPLSALVAGVTADDVQPGSELGAIIEEFSGPDAVAPIATALRDGEWDDVVARFGAGLDDDRWSYLGPMRAGEDAPPAPGLLAATREPIGSAVAAAVARRAGDIGERIFGFACDLRGRVVEFHDLALGAGPFIDAEVAPIALFSPYYFAGWRDADRQQKARRTIMFSNVVSTRFSRVTAAAVLDRVTIDGRPPAVMDASAAQLRSAVACWLTLHEMIHGSGPAPLFEAWTGKHRIRGYGVIEELRVDMTAFLAAGLVDPSYGELARELIVLERLFRSARRGLRLRALGRRPTLDELHGLAWLDALAGQGVRRVGDRIDLALADVEESVTHVLGRVYALEQRAAESAAAPAVLEEGAATLHAFLDGRAAGAGALGWLGAMAELPDSLSLRDGA